MIIAQIASIRERGLILPRVIASLLPQVDQINLNLSIDIVDDDLVTRRLPAFLIDPKIRINYHDNSLQDGAKFIGAPEEPGHYVLVCDDDIEYPADFAERMIQLLDSYRLEKILSCMGKVLKPRPIKSYFKDELKCYKTFELVEFVEWIEIPGTCAMIYHTDMGQITHKSMTSPNADICVGAWAKYNGVKCLVVPHRADWLTDLTPLLPKGSPNMFDRYKNNDQVLTDFINAKL